jgi:hypothetical protein
MEEFNSNCLCYELGHQVCSHYESWCSEQEGIRWWETLSKEEQDSLTVNLCAECLHSFEDNPGKLLCRNCEEWIVTYGETEISF